MTETNTQERPMTGSSYDWRNASAKDLSFLSIGILRFYCNELGIGSARTRAETAARIAAECDRLRKRAVAFCHEGSVDPDFVRRHGFGCDRCGGDKRFPRPRVDGVILLTSAELATVVKVGDLVTLHPHDGHEPVMAFVTEVDDRVMKCGDTIWAIIGPPEGANFGGQGIGDWMVGNDDRRRWTHLATS